MQCPKCHSEVGEGKKFCKICGAALATPAQTQPATTGGSVERVAVPTHGESRGTLNCPKCGFAVKPERSFCGRCGAALNFPQRAEPKAFSTPHVRTGIPLKRRLMGPVRRVNWRKVRLAVGIPVSIAVLVVALWHFWPREPLPPQRIGTILDRATAGAEAIFNDAAPGRRTLLLSTGSDIWEIPSGKSIYEGQNIGYFLFSPDGKIVLLEGANTTLLNWRTKKITVLEKPAPQQFLFWSYGFSNDGTVIAASRENGSLHLFDTTTGKVIHALREGGNTLTQANDGRQTCGVTSVAFSPNGSSLASGELNGNVSLWNTKTGDLIATLPGQADEPCYGTEPQPLDPSSAVQAVSFSPDGRLLASQDGYGVVRVWQISTRSVVYTLPFLLRYAVGLTRVRFSPDGRFLVTTEMFSAQNGDVYQMYSVWNAASGRLLRSLSLPGYGTPDFLPDGDLAIAQASKGRVKVERWALRSRFRIPFLSSTTPTVEPTDPFLLQAYEESAMGILGAFQGNAGQYAGGEGKGSFPRNLEDLGRHSPPAMLYGYRYSYSPGPADAQGNITSYVLSARPLLYKQTGTRSFLVDQTGQVHATEEAREATAADPVFYSLQDATQLAAQVQGAAAAQTTPASQGNQGSGTLPPNLQSQSSSGSAGFSWAMPRPVQSENARANISSVPEAGCYGGDWHENQPNQFVWTFRLQGDILRIYRNDNFVAGVFTRTGGSWTGQLNWGNGQQSNDVILYAVNQACNEIHTNQGWWYKR
jgi:WD40 repeat protein